MFIGRYQAPHTGHMTIFDEYLSKGKPVLIAIRDVEPDENNPLTAHEVLQVWAQIYANNSLVKIIIVPDIASVNYGRGVGYEVTEIKVTDQIANVSATEIRRQIMSGETGWHKLVDSKAHDILEKLIKK
jgi:nicotinamide mononucleotide adenylyltransferase